MVSMKDIAQKCGVSVATVSKALNDHSDIGEETKNQIRQMAQEMGYFPNSFARALKTKRTYNLGVLFVDDSSSGLTHDYFAHVLDSFKRYAENNGYDITFINGQIRNNMNYLEHSRYRGVDGVVIACVDFDDSNVLELIRSDLPVVTIDHVFDDRISVVSDNAGGMQELTEYVCACGHRRIAYIHGDDTAPTRNRVASFYKVLAGYGVTPPDEYVCPSTYRNSSMAWRYTKKLLQLPERPTCILYPDDFSCIGGINAITEEGLRIPEDISVAGYDGSYVSRIFSPKITTMVQDTGEIGRIAAEKLISMIESPKSTIIEKIVVPGTLYVGASVGPV